MFFDKFTLSKLANLVRQKKPLFVLPALFKVVKLFHLKRLKKFKTVENI